MAKSRVTHYIGERSCYSRCGLFVPFPAEKERDPNSTTCKSCLRLLKVDAERDAK